MHLFIKLPWIPDLPGEMADVSHHLLYMYMEFYEYDLVCYSHSKKRDIRLSILIGCMLDLVRSMSIHKSSGVASDYRKWKSTKLNISNNIFFGEKKDIRIQDFKSIYHHA